MTISPPSAERQARPVDLEAMALISIVGRAAQEIRVQLERAVLRPEGISWGGFSLLLHLWTAGAARPMETRALAASMGCARPSVSSLCDTLQRDGLISRQTDTGDRRLVRVALTAAGRRTIERLFPRFNAMQTRLVAGLDAEDRHRLTLLLARLLDGVRHDETRSTT